MASKTLLDRLELPLAQCIDVEDRRALVRHAVHGLDGDVLQQMGRRAARVAITGVVAGPDARGGLEALREKSRSAQPVDFVADVATATGVTRVVIERWDVRELSGRPDRWQYAFLLREHLDPPASTKTDGPRTVVPGSTGTPASSTGTGTLVVEVAVEGEPDFDPSRVTVTAATTGPGGAATRELTDRAGGTWTDAAAPAGPHTVTATVADPPMAGSAQGTVRAGQTTPLRIVLAPTGAVARMFMVSFRFDSAFVEPCMRAQLRRAAAFARARPSQKVVVVGHTDRTGPGAYNQSLSERRARTVFAALRFGTGPAAADAAVAEWTAIRQRRTVASPTEKETGGWGAREYQQMLQELRFYPGRIDAVHGPLTDEAVRAFRCQHGLPPGTTVDDVVWSALIRAYLADDPPTLPAAQRLPNCEGTLLEWLGCGEEDPVLNTQSAHRPNRRVELLLTTAPRLPCAVPAPDTWGLPAPGHAAGEWCLGGPGASRTCFATRTAPAAPPRWLIQDAEPGTVAVQGLIEREVEDAATGVVTRVPAAHLSIVLITPRGEFLAGETGSGGGTPARTDAAGRFSFPGKTPGVYALEIQDSVLARPAADDDAAARGPTVCGAIPATGGALDVRILRDPVLREIRLRVIVHLMTALHPVTRDVRTCPDLIQADVSHRQRPVRDEAQARALVAEVNRRIWGRARIRMEVRAAVAEAFATPGRDGCAVDDAEFRRILVDSAAPNAVNLYFFGTLAAATGEVAVHTTETVQNGAGTPVRTAEGCALGDRVVLSLLDVAEPTQAEAEVIVAHALGEQLGLPHVGGTGAQAQNRLMRSPPAAANVRLVQQEVLAARAAPGARDCTPLSLRVAGATAFGGARGHRFVAVTGAGGADVTVDAVLPPHLQPPGGGTLAFTGGAAGAGPLQRTVARTAGPPVDVVARFRPAGGGTPLVVHVSVYVVDFDVDVIGAKRLAPLPATGFYAIRSATTPLVARAVLAPDPFLAPADLANWGAGTELPDPLRRSVPRATAGNVAVPVTVGTVTRTIVIQVAEDFTLEVTDAVRLANGNFLSVVDPPRTLTVRALLDPAPSPVPADLVVWGGTLATDPLGPLERLLQRDTARSGTVTATIGDVTHSVTIELVAMTLRVEGAVQAGGPAGTEFFAEIHPTLNATARVVLTPPPSAALPANGVAWSPPALVGPDPLVRTLRRNVVARIPVRATLAGTTRTVSFTVVQIEVTRAAGVAAPAATSVQVGLWDNAFDAAHVLTPRNGLAENANFVGSDTRRFHFRVRDPSVTGAEVSIDWRTRFPGGGADDPPAPGASARLSLLHVTGTPGVFTSRAVMLVTDDVDRAQATDSGLAPPHPEAGARAVGTSNHRLRRITVNDTHPLDSEVFAEYTPPGAPVPVATVRIPVFERGPEERRRIRVHMVNVRTSVGGTGVLLGARRDAAKAAFWSIYARAGVFMELDELALDPPASCLGWGTTRFPGDPIGQDPSVQAPTGDLFGNVVPSSEMRDLIAAVKLLPGFDANDLYVIYVARILDVPPPAQPQVLATHLAGQAFADDYATVASGARGFAFVAVRSALTQFTDVHEATHITTNLSGSIAGGHFDLGPDPSPGPGPVDGRNVLHRFPKVNTQGVANPKRLWNTQFINTARTPNLTIPPQIDAIRAHRFSRPY
ncbi:OmpA family protein [Longimicrobium sp.]|jgi:outer membrane protein OmpA-like peptidoglycan-associated protein|uniref:OmpA family protein n=1 Tax=Longimicrobium sp. TaxID=2029185 RepID=UPI0032C20E0B